MMECPDNIKVFLRYASDMIPIGLPTLKKLVEGEIERVKGDLPSLPIRFYLDPPKDEPQQIASFNYRNGTPAYFRFNLSQIDGFSTEDLLDTCRHEVAHYIAFQRYRGSQQHNERWQKICIEEVHCIPHPTKSRSTFAELPERYIRDSLTESKKLYLAGGDWYTVWNKALESARMGDLEALRFATFLAYLNGDEIHLPALMKKLGRIQTYDPAAKFLFSYITLNRDGKSQELVNMVRHAGEQGCQLANYLYGVWMVEGQHGLNKSETGLRYIATAVREHCVPAMEWYRRWMKNRRDFRATNNIIRLETGGIFCEYFCPGTACKSFAPYI